MKLGLLLLATLAMAGCVRDMDVAMMSRTSGERYSGELHGDGSGAGTMTLDFKGQQCSGPASRIASDERTVIGSASSYNNAGQSGGTLAAATISGDATVKALLSCPNGKGLRCVLKGRDLQGGGECSADDGQIYDVLVSRKAS